MTRLLRIRALLITALAAALGCGGSNQRAGAPVDGDAAARDAAARGADTQGADTGVTDAAYTNAEPGRGPCHRKPEKLTEIASTFSAIAVDGDDIFVFSDQLLRIPRFGGAVAVPPTPGFIGRQTRDIAVSDTQVFWVAPVTPGAATIGLYSRDRQFRTPAQLLFSAPFLDRFILSRTHFYFVQSLIRAKRILRVDRNNTAEALDFSGVESTTSMTMTVDEEFVYWATDTGLHRRRHDGAPRETLLDFPEGMFVYANNATHVFGHSYRSRTFIRVAKADGSIERVPTPMLRPPLAVAVDRDVLFIADSSGSVFRLPSDADAFVRLGGLGGFGGDDYLAVLGFDEENVYFQSGPPSPDGRVTAFEDDPLWLLRMCKSP